jgi:hypothetical protein
MPRRQAFRLCLLVMVHIKGVPQPVCLILIKQGIPGIHFNLSRSRIDFEKQLSAAKVIVND